MKRKTGIAVLLICLCVCLGSCTAAAAGLNRTSLEMLQGSRYRLKVSGKKASEVKWSSSNPKVASVNDSGVVKINGIGTASIKAKAGKNFKAVCKVTGVAYKKSGNELLIRGESGLRKYRCYSQRAYGYSSNGCVVTAVAIAASGFGKKYTPRDIQAGSVSSSYSVRYAVKKMKASAALHNRAAISLATAAQVLKDMGIKTKTVRRFTDSTAIKEITKHVKEGKPVLIKANTATHNGIRIAGGHHALVLVGIDGSGYGIFIDPMTGRINYAHRSGKYFKMSIATMVKYHMSQASGNYNAPYVTSLSTAGGYILIG